MSKISLTFHLSFLRVNTNSKKVCIFAQFKYYKYELCFSFYRHTQWYSIEKLKCLNNKL